MVIMDSPKTPYLIEWVDSYGCSPRWENIEDVKPTPLVCRSIGWIVHRDKKSVVIVPHLTCPERDGFKQQGCGDMTIPAACIVRITPLVPARRKRP